MLDVVFLAMFLVIPVMTWSIQQAKAGRYTLHKRVQLILAAVLLAAAIGWSVRTIGVNHVLRAQAFAVHNDWAVIPEAMEQRGTWPADAAARNLMLGLRDESLARPIVNPWFTPRWADRVFEGDYF